MLSPAFAGRSTDDEKEDTSTSFFNDILLKICYTYTKKPAIMGREVKYEI